MILGIDPGLKGALAIRSKDGLLAEPMPTNGDGGLHMPELARWLRAHAQAIKMAYVERAHAFPGMGVSGAFNYGAGWGAIQGVLSALGIPYELVTPAKWTKALHAGISSDLDPKVKSQVAASRIFPHMDFKASERCKKPHDGMIDAALIAEYGYRIHTRSEA